MLARRMLPRILQMAAPLGFPGLRHARADIRGDIVFGRDGYLFAAWEDVRRLNPQRMRLVLQLVAQVAQIMRDAGIQMAVPLIPTKARILADMLPPDFQPAPDVQRRYEDSMQELRRAGAIVPDCAAVLARLRTSQPEAVFFKADSHWTATGAEAAAQDMARAIQAAVQLPPSRHPGVRLGNAITVTHSGDLVALLPEPERPRFPPERFRVRPAVAASRRAGLLDEDGADIAVIGNSYMQPDYFGYPHVLSAALNRPVALAWKTARVGPYRVLLDYVTGSQFRAQRPKVLLWQLMEGSLEQMPDAGNWWEPASAIPTNQFLNDLRRAVAR
ncbi:alginate O-acetyltransferase AlgX-related protein [Rhodovarius lipocyclicus]|uniref:alginate O-acetyltransferase AlgX-related protein n=1 Tax=Rhodovarius lipocyclicus TaxID=268410 RepID=UPI00135A9F3A|nr:hypothetical protein [Rhodovarius lipocyclicus]